jgi:deoxyribodipyrimidine photo-lyase
MKNFGKLPKSAGDELLWRSVLEKLYSHRDDNANFGGREMGLKRLRAAAKKQVAYSKHRDELSYETSMLSPYLRFGCLSPREVWWTLKTHLPKEQTLLKQLLWREFYYNIYAADPSIYKVSMQRPLRGIRWSDNKVDLRAWAKGCTGFPVVDAAMRQLLTSGYMHNRGRLISAGFLTKVLRINWVIGEKWFAKHLLDADRASNGGGWQWCAGTGTDASPWFRAFNPWRQSKRFDPDALYIKRWIPELADVPAEDLHTWDVSHKKWIEEGVAYPAPICDYKASVKRTIQEYKRSILQYRKHGSTGYN